MNKEDVIVVAQLFTAIKDSITKLEKSIKEGDNEQVEIAKKAILSFQQEIDKIL